MVPIKIFNIIQELEKHHIAFSVVSSNKVLLHDGLGKKFEDSVLIDILMKAYGIYLKHQTMIPTVFTYKQYNMSVMCHSDNVFDAVIISKEDINVYIINANKRYKMLDYYADVLEKFQDTEIYEAIKLILVNPEKSYKISELAEYSCVSSRTFTRKFKKIYGESFLEFYRPFKIQFAKEMIRQGFEFNDISNQLGYCERSYFDYVFKKATGMSPGEYRNNKGDT
ncbi:hypothetical protein FACS1894193_13070 [Bacilli bacterium]|nr:hypothetical protein FACS1894192_00330 [Bacilli bacterium]GHU44539.1 hypothetical protein FACS1894193_13070 [Bacilli bacterium]